MLMIRQRIGREMTGQDVSLSLIKVALSVDERILSLESWFIVGNITFDLPKNNRKEGKGWVETTIPGYKGHHRTDSLLESDPMTPWHKSFQRHRKRALYRNEEKGSMTLAILKGETLDSFVTWVVNSIAWKKEVVKNDLSSKWALGEHVISLDWSHEKREGNHSFERSLHVLWEIQNSLKWTSIAMSPPFGLHEQQERVSVITVTCQFILRMTWMMTPSLMMIILTRGSKGTSNTVTSETKQQKQRSRKEREERKFHFRPPFPLLLMILNILLTPSLQW